jgi:hypothetical protein
VFVFEGYKLAILIYSTVSIIFVTIRFIISSDTRIFFLMNIKVSGIYEMVNFGSNGIVLSYIRHSNVLYYSQYFYDIPTKHS